VIDLAVIGGLLFAAVLAWYLTRPIRRLRQGFGRLAEGDLTVRLRGQMGRRRDELADLARDFDQMADRLQQLVSSRDRLLHDVSHELRSPLARLHMAIGLARQNPQKITATLERIELEAGRLDELVGELLTLARIEGDDPRLDQYVDLVELIGAVAEDARFEAEQVGVAVRLGVESFTLEGASRPPVKGNGELLRRGLENVVRNAIRFSSRGQHVDIVVELRLVDGTYVVEIADEGPGAPEAALETMFEPFVRLHEGERGRGFGLGLAIARRAVAAHRGAICARNRSQGGLAVRVELPAEAPALAS
jgi:two-component system OmpR family sensor kinase